MMMMMMMIMIVMMRVVQCDVTKMHEFVEVKRCDEMFEKSIVKRNKKKEIKKRPLFKTKLLVAICGCDIGTSVS